MTQGIGTLNESTLHRQLKQWYARKDDLLEHNIGRHWIDIVRDDLLIEVQTGNFAHLKSKLNHLIDKYRIRVVYPRIIAKKLVYVNDRGEVTGTRKSPGKPRNEWLFAELVHIPNLIGHRNFELEIIDVNIEEQRLTQDKKKRRPKVIDRKLLKVASRFLLSSPADYLDLLPDDIPGRFTNRELASCLGLVRRRVYPITNTLRKIGVLSITGKKGRENIFLIRQGGND